MFTKKIPERKKDGAWNNIEIYKTLTLKIKISNIISKESLIIMIMNIKHIFRFADQYTLLISITGF